MTDYIMRAPCKYGCDTTIGFLRRANGQDVVRCSICAKAQYNAPRHETGMPVLHKNTRPKISVSQRSRLLERDNHTCVGCHRNDLPLDIGHLLSVADGAKVGATERELYSDENLSAMCDACNAGCSDRTQSLRLVHQILRARVLRVQEHGEPA